MSLVFLISLPPPALPPSPPANAIVPFFNSTTLKIGYVSIFYPYEYESVTGARKGVLPNMWEQLMVQYELSSVQYVHFDNDCAGYECTIIFDGRIATGEIFTISDTARLQPSHKEFFRYSTIAIPSVMLLFEADRPTRPTWNIDTYIIFTNWKMETVFFSWIIVTFVINELRKIIFPQEAMTGKNNEEDDDDEEDEETEEEEVDKVEEVPNPSSARSAKAIVRRVLGRDAPSILSRNKLVYAGLIDMSVDDYEPKQFHLIIFDEFIVMNQLDEKTYDISFLSDVLPIHVFPPNSDRSYVELRLPSRVYRVVFDGRRDEAEEWMNNVSEVIALAYRRDYDKIETGESSCRFGSCVVSRGRISTGRTTPLRVQILEGDENINEVNGEEEDEFIENLTLEGRRKRAILRYVFGGKAKSIIYNNNVQFTRLVNLYDSEWEPKEVHILIIDQCFVFQELISTKYEIYGIAECRATIKQQRNSSYSHIEIQWIQKIYRIPYVKDELNSWIPELLTIIENEVTKEKNKSGNIEERKLDKQIIPWNGFVCGERTPLRTFIRQNPHFQKISEKDAPSTSSESRIKDVSADNSQENPGSSSQFITRVESNNINEISQAVPKSKSATRKDDSDHRRRQKHRIKQPKSTSFTKWTLLDWIRKLLMILIGVTKTVNLVSELAYFTSWNGGWAGAHVNPAIVSPLTAEEAFPMFLTGERTLAMNKNYLAREEWPLMFLESAFIDCPNQVDCLYIVAKDPKVIALVDRNVYLQYRMDPSAPKLKQIIAKSKSPSNSANINTYITGMAFGFPTSRLLPIRKHNIFMNMLNTQYSSERMMIEVERSLPGKQYVQLKRIEEDAKNTKDDRAKPLSFAHVEFPFYLLIGGLVLASIVFLLSHLLRWYQTRRRKRLLAHIYRICDEIRVTDV